MKSFKNFFKSANFKSLVSSFVILCWGCFMTIVIPPHNCDGFFYCLNVLFAVGSFFLFRHAFKLNE